MSLLPVPCQKLSINGCSVRYCAMGQGTPLILIHGLGATLEYWYKNIEPLSAYYQVIAFDLPGFGASDLSAPVYDLNYYVNFLEDFYSCWNISQAHVVAHSLGGGIALGFSERYPHRIKKLALLASTGFARQVSLEFRLLTLPWLGNLALKASEQQFSAAVRDHVADPTMLSQAWLNTIYNIQNTPANQKVLRTIIKNNLNLLGIKQSTLAPIQKNIAATDQIPKLILWGKQDPVLNYTIHTRAAKKLLPQTPIIGLSPCGHLLQIECADQVNSLLLEFLK